MANYASSDDGLNEQCALHTTSIYMQEAGSSPEGCVNMAGNVWEYCHNYYDEDYYQYSESDNPSGPEIRHYVVMKGGSIYDNERVITTTHRGSVYTQERHSNIGFRVVRPIN